MSGAENDGGGADQPRFLTTVIRYSGLGLEMGTAVGIGAWLGWWLDGRYHTSPWGILGGVLLGGASAGWMVWRSLSALNRGRGEQDERA